eukprot:CAMPEP_0198138486 /NCGR_PEP_ID=MMETSP1443-20131203/1891_1 /TAXON_ID=186043 /ORGANISM="Entomoneis sp., Strain CCMP2396" /LENGTH=174 /DNA_ID=CAMNT_0043800277 /DNA_START=105 /DNA_END=632 /DNA_ORIENTATION=+
MASSSTAQSTENNQDESDAPYHAELMSFLRESRDMRTAAKHSIKQGLWAGGGAMAGGLIMGPVGGLVGGVAGSLMGFMQSDDYDGIVQQLGKLPAAQQGRLVRAVGKVLTHASTTSAVGDLYNSPDGFRSTLTEYATKKSVREQIWKVCNEALAASGVGGDNGSSSSPETVLTS